MASRCVRRLGRSLTCRADFFAPASRRLQMTVKSPFLSAPRGEGVLDFLACAGGPRLKSSQKYFLTRLSSSVRLTRRFPSFSRNGTPHDRVTFDSVFGLLGNDAKVAKVFEQNDNLCAVTLARHEWFELSKNCQRFSDASGILHVGIDCTIAECAAVFCPLVLAGARADCTTFLYGAVDGVGILLPLVELRRVETPSGKRIPTPSASPMPLRLAARQFFLAPVERGVWHSTSWGRGDSVRPASAHSSGNYPIGVPRWLPSRKSPPVLWFDDQGEDAAKFYTRHFSEFEDRRRHAATARRARSSTARSRGR